MGSWMSTDLHLDGYEIHKNWYKFEFSMCAFDYRIGGGLVHLEVVIPAALSFLPLHSVAVGRAPTTL